MRTIQIDDDVFIPATFRCRSHAEVCRVIDVVWGELAESYKAWIVPKILEMYPNQPKMRTPAGHQFLFENWMKYVEFKKMEFS